MSQVPSAAQIPGWLGSLMNYEPEKMWEVDTQSLPKSLQHYRRHVRSFASEHLAGRALAFDLDPHSNESRDILRAAAKAGLLSDMLPWPFGSAPLANFGRPFHFGASLKMEELCAACGGLGLLIGAHALGVAPVMLSGDLDVWLRLMRPILRKNASGTPSLLAYAITEPAGGSDVEDSEGASHYKPGTIARRTTGGWLLTGRKVFISGGDCADYVSTFAAIEGEGIDSWTCFLVSTRQPGFEVGRCELKMGQRASAAAELIFEDAYVPDDHVIGGLRKGWELNRAVLNYSRIPVAAIALGIARGAFEATLDFCQNHRLGNRELVHYQEVQMALADMIVKLTAMRSMIWEISAEWSARQYKASAAKVFCSDTAVQICDQAMELMGDHGILHSNRAEKGFRDARLTQIYEGTNQINRLAIIEDQWHELTSPIKKTNEVRI